MDAEAEAVSRVNCFLILGWESSHYFSVEAEAAEVEAAEAKLKSTASVSRLTTPTVATSTRSPQVYLQTRIIAVFVIVNPTISMG